MKPQSFPLKPIKTSVYPSPPTTQKALQVNRRHEQDEQNAKNRRKAGVYPAGMVLLCLALNGCAVRAYYPNGRVAFADYTDFEGTTEIVTKGFTFRRTGRQDASTPTRTAIAEAGNTAFKLGLGATGAVVP